MLLLLASCASQTKLAEPLRTNLSARHAGRTIELRQSCYYGDLYDENEKWLLSPYPFADTYHIVDLDNAPIHPTGQKDIVPAGTRFVIHQIEFPDRMALAKRMLTTPRFNPWIYLKPAVGQMGLPTTRPWFILVLPMDLDKEEQVEAAIAELVAPEGEVTAWMNTLKPTAQAAIRNKTIEPGMSEQELTAAMGKPQRWFNEGKVRVAWYGAKEAHLSDGAVTEVKEGRKVEEPKPGPAGESAEGKPGEAAPGGAAAPSEPKPGEAAAATAAGAEVKAAPEAKPGEATPAAAATPETTAPAATTPAAPATATPTPAKKTPAAAKKAPAAKPTAAPAKPAAKGTAAKTSKPAQPTAAEKAKADKKTKADKAKAKPK